MTQFASGLKKGVNVAAHPRHLFLGSAPRANIVPTSQRPDIFLYNASSKTAMIAELTVPFEQNTDKAHSRKQNKYASLMLDLNRGDLKTSLVLF